MAIKTPNMRLDAANLARRVDAPRTLAVVNDDSKNSSIDEILCTAVDEVGLDKVVMHILDSDHPEWALGAIRYLPDLGEHREALRTKARVSATADDGMAVSLQSVTQLQMSLPCGVGYQATCSMEYFTPPFNNQWTASTKSSATIDVCQSVTIGCLDYSNPASPLQPGDHVMLTVFPGGGRVNPTGFQFIYEPDATLFAQIQCGGTTLLPTFSWSTHPNP